MAGSSFGKLRMTPGHGERGGCFLFLQDRSLGGPQLRAVTIGLACRRFA